jgi:hypothetical protein
MLSSEEMDMVEEDLLFTETKCAGEVEVLVLAASKVQVRARPLEEEEGPTE